MSECASRRVERHCQMGRLFPLDKFQDIFGESEQDGHVGSFGVYHRMTEECIVHLEYECMSVNQEKSVFHNRVPLFSAQN